MAITMSSFALLLMIGVPISIVLGLASVVYVAVSGDLALLETMPQRLYSGIETHGLLAIPLFMLAGELMNLGGITSRLIQFSQTLFGHFKGGLAYVNIIANMFLSSILGSSLAQTAMMSRVMVPAMQKEGYTKEFSAATTAAAAMLGPIIPPSMLFILYSVGAGTSVSKMFLAGILPGIILTIGFSLLIAYLGYKNNFPKSEKRPVKEMWSATIQVIPALLVPAIIILGITLGIFTATESAAIACALAFVVGILLYRELKWADIPTVFLNTARSTATVTLLLAMANLFGLVLTFERVPQVLAAWMGSITENPLIFLLILNIFLLLVGMIMDGIASIVILVPILVPIAKLFEIDLVHLGVIICINTVIGSLTPPVGAGLFVASSVGEVKLEPLIRQIWPFLGVSVVVLFILTYLPTLVLWIPSLFS
ncbi:TRAP transporter large permease [Domibacillus epiphyticus]|uniref:C4-dicarboxylate ABC transporter permease n=1 Tax=Domibacillus epiphyticus TaxID=1714355 RepID=A0A1V2A899_9BACI|nr:TRAP transporter large permease [Domibacillus epiphyticus]OMP67235.1 C4-dicarboxylate ABC transporter permease [Domibacillus epiphyticus]